VAAAANLLSGALEISPGAESMRFLMNLFPVLPTPTEDLSLLSSSDTAANAAL